MNIQENTSIENMYIYIYIEREREREERERERVCGGRIERSK